MKVVLPLVKNGVDEQLFVFSINAFLDSYNWKGLLDRIQ